MRKIHLVSLVVCALAAGGCGLKDIRPDGWQTAFADDAAEARGKEILAAMAEAHGGLEAFAAHRTVVIELEDTFPNPVLRMFTSPWPADPIRLRQEILIPGENSRLELLNSPAVGDVWGIQNWATYRQKSGREIEFVDDATIKFWLPTLGYFFQAPFRLHEASVVRDLGRVDVGGRSYDRVFLSWNTAEPQKDVDQYIAYIDAETHLLTFLEYTVREMGGFVSGTMHYRDHETIDGIVVARTMALVEGPGGPDGLHRVSVLDVRFGVPLETSRIIPRPDLRKSK